MTSHFEAGSTQNEADTRSDSGTPLTTARSPDVHVIGNLIKLRDAHPHGTPAWHRLVETIRAIRTLKSEPDPAKRSLLRQSINDHMGWLERRGCNIS